MSEIRDVHVSSSWPLAELAIKVSGKTTVVGHVATAERSMPATPHNQLPLSY